MRVEFHQHDNDYEAGRAVRGVVENHFLSVVSQSGHPTTTSCGAIDGVPTGSKAGFPKLGGWRSASKEVLTSFVALRMDWMRTVLKLRIKHNGHQPLSLGGSFFIRAYPDKKVFLEVNFQEELDASCADPIEILGLTNPEDFTLIRVLMAGQRSLSVGGNELVDGHCNCMSMTLARALESQRGHYKWRKEGTLSGDELCPELPLRAAGLGFAMVKEGFSFAHGTLGPKLRQLAEQYLV